ncbi:MAG: hypothetical protein E6G10_14785 [Actinobacteria bacterium]|nr:MAG: hypothetical protein E6G10_14785 [Actinomycetota bacterium]
MAALAALFASAALAAGYPPPSSQGLRPGSYAWICGDPSEGPVADEAICRKHAPRRLRRPLRIPRLDPGAQCPRSSAARVSPQFGIALGRGPAYPVPFPGGIYHFNGGRVEGGWMYAKVLWIVAPGYLGPLLVRGRQLDGTNWLGFEGGARPFADLQIPPVGADFRGWRDTASYTRFRGPGCYGYQIDGTTFSRVIVFSAEP